ncbi:hypothetical protein [Pseudonocardia charpentierae]|uniref:Uncharacterized protein n=1 Tax=Pseudonocardia charpentierae TaxID=3075545 RepID=A0ABU2NC03_9PSEU|nr:hypothetical protein [Pseudonocardia sp. DSM 45834]MDT0351117.1 hypothetical protein [Pseudonocardia sp. DSM 45834]
MTDREVDNQEPRLRFDVDLAIRVAELSIDVAEVLQDGSPATYALVAVRAVALVVDVAKKRRKKK